MPFITHAVFRSIQGSGNEAIPRMTLSILSTLLCRSFGDDSVCKRLTNFLIDISPCTVYAVYVQMYQIFGTFAIGKFYLRANGRLYAS